MMELTEKEKKLIELIRKIKYGKVVVILEGGQPTRIEEVRESVKL